MWFRNFEVEQSGDPSHVHALYQDNKSTILLQNNVRLLCQHGSKFIIHIRYLFITDRTKQKEIQVKNCATCGMIADYYFTKLLHGSIFKKFRNMIFGIIEEDIDTYKENYEQSIMTFGIVTEN